MNERLNVRRMQMPERPDEGRPFDPEQEIPPEKWKEIEDHLVVARRGGSRKSLASYASQMQILKPNSPVLTQDDWGHMEVKLNEYRAKTAAAHGRLFLTHAKMMHTLDPKKPTLSQSDIIRIRDQLHSGPPEIRDDIRTYADTYVLLGEKIDEISDYDWETAQIELDESRKHEDWWSFVETASCMKILRPDLQFVTPADWAALRKDWKSKEQLTELPDYLEYAADLKILAAKDIKVSKEKGLEIIMPEKDVAEKSPAMPATSDI